MKKAIVYLAESVINSYAILFFSQSKIFGAMLLLASFFNFDAGLSGLICTVFAIVLCMLMGYQQLEIKQGLFSFNALLFGIGFGTFYHANTAFFIWLMVGCLVCTVITVNLWRWLAVRRLPVLSIPFIISFWLLLSAANGIFQMGLYQKSSSILNELNNFNLPAAANLYLPYYIGLFFKALSAILFQNNALTGLLIALGLLIHSRIAFTVTVLGFICVLLFNSLTGIYPNGPSYYHLGSNFMMTAMAIGSFFMIPSFRSFLWAIITIPVTLLLISAFTQLIGQHNLPILSLPFCAVTLLVLLFLNNSAKFKPGLTLFQNYSPEENLYRHLNGKERLDDFKYFNIKLPFMGNWTVSQGYDGKITHKGDWGQALDFVIEDDEGKTYRKPGLNMADYYCYGKPVLACGDGIIENVTDHIDDNAIGDINTKDNWGNTIVIKHTTGLYSKVSHLKKKSAKFKPGDFVKQGDVIGICGNSGRSPEPHLHFQLQATPFIGSKTLSYPFANYVSQNGKAVVLNSFDIPKEGSRVHSMPVNNALRSAFSFQPGLMVVVRSTKGVMETFETYADAYNQSYIYSKSTNSYAYFVNNGTSFYFTAFYGNKNSLLYSFYLAAYKVIFTDNPDNETADAYPLQLIHGKPIGWLNDFAAPFFPFIKLDFKSHIQSKNEELVIRSYQNKQIFGRSAQTMQASVLVRNNSIKGFNINYNGINLETSWSTENPA